MVMENRDSWKHLLEQKEKEWKDVTRMRIHSLETACEKKEKEFHDLQCQFNKLKDDFKYNLRLLEERDQELEKYDISCTELKAQLNVKNSEISLLKIQLDDFEKSLKRETTAINEVHEQFQQRLREKQEHLDAIKCSRGMEIQDERKEFQAFRHKLQLQLNEVRNELDTQKRELTTGFEEALKKREHEFKVLENEMSARVLEFELKAKLTAKELDAVRSSRDETILQLKSVENHYRKLEKMLKEKEWQLIDTEAMKDARIQDLQSKLEQTQTDMQRMREDFQRKYAEIDRFSKQREAALAKTKESYHEKEQALHKVAGEMKSRIEDKESKIRQLQRSHQDSLEARDAHIEKLCEELQEVREKWSRGVQEISHEQVSRDVELQNLRTNYNKVVASLGSKKEEIERYKQELSQAAERELSLEQRNTQLNLDWENKCEEIKHAEYEKSEDLIRKLTRARDEALAGMKEKERQLEQQHMLTEALQRDKNAALVLLKEHGIPLNKNLNSTLITQVKDLEDLEKQNSSLRAIIHEMKEQMEQLSNSADTKNVFHGKDEYIQTLEREIQDLREETERQQNERNPRNLKSSNLSSADCHVVETELKDNAIVKAHLESLNDMIGSLRNEKLELAAQVKKQQARLQHLEKLENSLSKQPQQKQVEIDNLQYELSTQTRRHQVETAGLHQQISNLELQLLETRKESDQYYKENLQRNMEVTALSKELSVLKMELADKKPFVNYGAQELVIQQLQDEILRMKHQPQGVTSTDVSNSMNGDIPRGRGQTTNITIQELQLKLVSAAKHIAQLAKEKQQLIEIGNRLRAEKQNSGISFPTNVSRNPIQKHVPSMPASNQFPDKFNQLERLQYQLTRQELQFAQRYPQKLERVNAPESSLPARSSDEMGDREVIKDNQAVDHHGLKNLQHSMDTSLPNTVQSMMLSSAGGESLKEVWKMLEDGSSDIWTPRMPKYVGNKELATSSHGHSENETWGSEELLISGTKAGIGSRHSVQKKLSNALVGKSTRVKSNRPRGRNYNTGSHHS